MENKKDLSINLQQEVRQLREEIELGDDSLPIDLGFPKLLMEIDETLASETLDKKKLEQYAFGIFRMVTESHAFEQSDLGKKLLAIIPKIKGLLRS